MSDPKVIISVIINTYNCAKYVVQAVESVLDQTRHTSYTELIVVDDGSVDDTADRLRVYISDNKINYIKKSNGGQASALNRGYAESRGSIIVFLDGDDYWLPGYLERIVKTYDSLGCGAFFSNLEKFYESDPSRPREPWRANDQDLEPIRETVLIRRSKNHRGFMLSPSSGQTVHRRVAERIFPIPLEYNVYADLYLHQMTHLQTDVLYAPFPLVAYRAHDKSWMHTIDKEINLDHRKHEIDLLELTVREMKLRDTQRVTLFAVKDLENRIQERREGLVRWDFLIHLKKGKWLRAFRGVPLGYIYPAFIHYGFKQFLKSMGSFYKSIQRL